MDRRPAQRRRRWSRPIGPGNSRGSCPVAEVRSGALDLFEAASGFRSAHRGDRGPRRWERLLCPVPCRATRGGPRALLYGLVGEERRAATASALSLSAVEGRVTPSPVSTNDVGLALFDSATGGGFDGLEPHGVNRNQGAESTLAFVATMAQARALCRRVRPVVARAAASASSR